MRKFTHPDTAKRTENKGGSNSGLSLVRSPRKRAMGASHTRMVQRFDAFSLS